MQLTESEIHAIKQRVKKRIEECLKRDEIMGIIKCLARSQGSYSRLYQFLRSGCDDAESMIQDLEDKCFNDAVDVIMYLEEGCQKKSKLVKENIEFDEDMGYTNIPNDILEWSRNVQNLGLELYRLCGTYRFEDDELYEILSRIEEEYNAVCGDLNTYNFAPHWSC